MPTTWASMGPSQRRDGKQRNFLERTRVVSSFNGAISTKRWKDFATNPTLQEWWEASMGPSQRRDGKIDPNGGCSIKSRVASMGPSQRRDGKISSNGGTLLSVALQWGHLNEEMERNGTLIPRASVEIGFNGAISTKRWKEGLLLIEGSARHVASMGPSQRRDGKISTAK